MLLLSKGNKMISQHRAYLGVAVSSSPRLWMDVFALPEKSNMGVTESDPDPKPWQGPKNVHDFLLTVRPLS